MPCRMQNFFNEVNWKMLGVLDARRFNDGRELLKAAQSPNQLKMLCKITLADPA